jgi:hypothetical protein
VTRVPGQPRAALRSIGVALVVALTSTASWAGSPAGYWHGTSVVTRTARFNLAVLNQQCTADFWFVVDRDGHAHGEATVQYAMNVDDAKLRTLIEQVGGALGSEQASALSALLTALGMPSAGVANMYARASGKVLRGIAVAYDEGSPIRRGSIVGTLSNGVLHLTWESRPKDMGYSTRVLYSPLGRDRTLAAHPAPAYSPFPVDADLREPVDGQWRADVPEARSTFARGKAAVTCRWSAELVPSGKH